MALDKAYTLTMGGKTWAVDCPKVEHTGDTTIDPNVYNDFGLISTLSITKGAEKPSVVNVYIIRFIAGAGCALTFNGWELNWVGGNSPVFEIGKTYEITIIDNFAAYINS